MVPVYYEVGGFILETLGCLQILFVSYGIIVAGIVFLLFVLIPLLPV